jgi:hypothetical protein
VTRNTKDLVSVCIGVPALVAGVWIVVDHGGWWLLLGILLLAVADRAGRW